MLNADKKPTSPIHTQTGKHPKPKKQTTPQPKDGMGQPRSTPSSQKRKEKSALENLLCNMTK